MTFTAPKYMEPTTEVPVQKNLDSSETNKQRKKRMTLYWGISLDAETVMNYPEIKELLSGNEELVPLKKIHTTLLYVGKKENKDEQVFLDLISCHEIDNLSLADSSKKPLMCRVTVTGHGFSEKAVALRVDKVEFIGSGEDVPSFAVMQHVTVALSKETKAVDSVKTLQGEGTIIEYDTPLVLEGELKRYFY